MLMNNKPTKQGRYYFLCIGCGLKVTVENALDIDTAKIKFFRLHDDFNMVHKAPHCNAVNYRYTGPDGKSTEF